MLAQYYTTLHNYCEDTGFPSPAPPVENVIKTWEDDFSTLRLELESDIAIISTGKTVRTPMKQEDQTRGGTVTRMNIRNGIRDRRTSSNKLDHRKALTSPPAVPRIMAPPMSSSESQSSIPRVPSPSSPAISSPQTYSGASTPASDYFTSGAGGSFSPAAPRTDYFARDRIPSSSSLSSIAMAKKKPPPPPPKKSGLASIQYVTALYSFEGQGDGDLVFNEGDKIKVIKKTGNMDDWWEGELRGQRGSFPANYCK
jgi:amphiphysin